jgi:hypothetical protein
LDVGGLFIKGIDEREERYVLGSPAVHGSMANMTPGIAFAVGKTNKLSSFHIRPDNIAIAEQGIHRSHFGFAKFLFPS